MTRSILWSLLLLGIAGEAALAEPLLTPWSRERLTQSKPPNPDHETWEAWKKILANPIGNARAALARGDRRLMAVGGYTNSAPGADHEAMERYGYVVLEGAEGCVGSSYFRERAREYATRYNQYILNEGS